MDTPKKERSYVEFVVVIGGITAVYQLSKPNFGFILQEGAEALGNNSAILFIYTIFLIAVVRMLVKARKRDHREGSKKYSRSALLAIMLLMVLQFTSAIYRAQKHQKETTAILEDALYETNQSGQNKHVSIIRDILQSSRTEQKKYFASTITMDSSNILEFKSYETKKSLQSLITLLQGSIQELDKADESTLKIEEALREKIRNDAQLSEKEKTIALRGFSKSVNNPEKVHLANQRYATMKQSYKEVLELYQFLLKNFDDYTIQIDESGEENIIFSTDKNIETFNNHSLKIQTASLRFNEADSALREYINKNLQNKGANITIEDVERALPY